MSTTDESAQLENTPPSPRAPEAEGTQVTDDSITPPAVRKDHSFNDLMNQLPKQRTVL